MKINIQKGVQKNICYREHLKVNRIYLKSGLNAMKILKKCSRNY